MAQDLDFQLYYLFKYVEEVDYTLQCDTCVYVHVF